jgi:hypothetical protein
MYEYSLTTSFKNITPSGDAIGYYKLITSLILRSCTTVLRSTQPLTEISTRNLPGGKGRPVRKADNPTAICEPTV